MNQGKLDVVKQEMARRNIKILGISELKWGQNHGTTEPWTEVHNIAQEAVTKTIPKKKKCKKAKWVSEEVLQIAEKIREVKKEKGRDINN